MTLLPLESFRRELSFNPYHFWQQAGISVPVSSKCNALVYEYAWQSADAVGRSEIRNAIMTAEERLRTYLGYSIAPHYIIETHAYPRYPDVRFSRVGYAGGDDRWITLQLDETHIISVGTQVKTLIEDIAVVFTDENFDGVDDTFQITTTIPTTETNINNIAAYFTAADRLNADGPVDRWRIQPVKVTISVLGLVTIRGPSWLLVKPILYEGVSPDPIDPTDPTQFVTNISVYRQYITSGTGVDYNIAQAILIWESRPYPLWANSYPVVSTDPAAIAWTYARAGIRDAERGIIDFGQAVYNATTGTWNAYTELDWTRPPDRVEVRYLAGIPLAEDGDVNPRYRTLAMRMAAAELPRRICGCEEANRELYNWQFDLARTGGANDESYQAVSASDLTNPFGTRKGHVYAWHEVQGLGSTIGFSV